MVRINELSGGTPIVRKFEQKWRDMVGAKYALTTCNGTAALYSAFYGLGVGPGDDPRMLFREGHGLDNVRQRLRTRYSAKATLRIEPAGGGRGTVARLSLPAPAVAAIRQEVRR